MCIKHIFWGGRSFGKVLPDLFFRLLFGSEECKKILEIGDI